MIAVRLTDGKQDILLGTALCLINSIPENSLRPLGRTRIRCERYFSKRNDVVVGLDVAYAESEDEVLVVTEKVMVNEHL